MGGASKEAKCASSAEPRAWTREELEQARRWVGKLQLRIAKAQKEPFIGFSTGTMSVHVPVRVHEAITK